MMHCDGVSTLGVSAPLRWGAAGVSTPEGAFVLPVGTVTFLLTDVAGSTRLWETETDVVMRAAVVRHYEILAQVVDAHGGVRPQEQGEGDSIVAAFARPSDALAAACAAQEALFAEEWATAVPLRVRIAVHTGEAQLRDDANYAGQAIIRTARLRAVGHGGQVLVSGATRDLAVDQVGDRFELRSLGEHRLRDLGRPEHVWQLVVPGVVDEFAALVSLDSVPNSLPVSLSPFIGREPEIAELADLVLTERLVTATGTGGAGKTRLAQQVGAALIDRFPAGVWWVELAALDDTGVDGAVRAAFGISEGSVTPLPEAVRRLLDGRACLLIMDNCEHVTDATAPLVEELLRAAGTLHVLATSRVMLDIPGEHAWRVPALALPEPGVTVPLEALSQYDSVRLFCDRARRARPNFELTTTNGPAIAEICVHLGGIPLAIELAAARTRMLDPQRILDGLDDAFRILGGGSKALMARQQTLSASIAWSYDLLSTVEQTLLRRLSAFVDGWTLDTAEAICPDPDDSGTDTLDRYGVFDALDRLVDHSLVLTTDTPTGTRFGMLETIRQYAQQRLATDPSEHDAVRSRHSHHFTDWATSLEQALLAGGSDLLVESLEAERSNLLSATEHATETGEPTRAVLALYALAPVWDMWAPLSTHMLALLDRLDPIVAARDEWRALLLRSRTLDHRSDVVGQFDTLTRMIQSAKDAGEAVGVASGRWITRFLLAISGEPVLDEMRDIIDEQESSDPAWAAYHRLHLAFMAANLGRFQLATESLAATRPLTKGPLLQAPSDLASGIVAFNCGDVEQAHRHLTATLESRSPSVVVASFAMFYVGFVGADLGLDLTQGAEHRLRQRCEVEGNTLSGSMADGLLAIRHLLADDLDEAHRCLRRSIDTADSLGVPMSWPNEHYALAAALDGYVDAIGGEGGAIMDAADHRARAERHLRSGDYPAALDEAHQALALALPERVLRSALFTLECISRILTAAGRHTEAARLRGACDEFRSERSLVPYPCLQQLLDDAATVSRAALGDDDYDAAHAEGATLTLDAASDYARRLRTRHAPAKVGWDALTPTEASVAELVAEGLTNRQVATELLMGTETVKTHLSRVFGKIGVANRKELILAASRRAAERHR